MSFTHKQEVVLRRRKNESHSRLQRLSARHYLQFSFTIAMCDTGSLGETVLVNQRETVCDINSIRPFLTVLQLPLLKHLDKTNIKSYLHSVLFDCEDSSSGRTSAVPPSQ